MRKAPVYTSILLSMLILGGCREQDAENSVDTAPKELFWGDIHNHNSVGQIKGSLERSYEIARSHLDFYAFTPQSQWPDMVEIPKGKNAQFIKGFESVTANWDRNVQLAQDYYQPGQFATLLGYEVHFNHGDFHILFPKGQAELEHLSTIQEWQKLARERGAMLIPHHPAYKPGWRGFDWSLVEPDVTPVVEICSEHGNAESDRSPIRYIRHSMGGRYTRSTVQSLWESGARVGVVASTDDHLGFPGAYGEGLAAVWADSLDRESIFEAIKAKRTYGVNADRIRLAFRLNGHWMGETIRSPGDRRIEIDVTGEDVVDRIEVLKNNRVIFRNHPIDGPPGLENWDQPILCRIEFGWGPWSAFDMARICDWEFKVTVEEGQLIGVSPHFQSRPFDEDRRHRVEGVDSTSCRVYSFTSRQNALEERPTNDIVLKIQGSPTTRIRLELVKPRQESLVRTFDELKQSSAIHFTGPFSSESVMIHRLVFGDHYSSSFQFVDSSDSDETDWYYVRVAQTNGSYAWSSPIWVTRN